MAKRKADGGDLLACVSEDNAELEIKSYEDMTPSFARNNPNVKTLRISCFVKATSPCGLPANGMAVCKETAERIPYFLVLFPQLEEVHLGGYTVDKMDWYYTNKKAILAGEQTPPPPTEPFWFTLRKQAVRQQKRDDGRADREVINEMISVVFNLVNSLCEAYKKGFLSTVLRSLVYSILPIGSLVTTSYAR